MLLTFERAEDVEARIAELRDFVQVANEDDDVAWERALDTVAGWVISMSHDGRVRRSELRYCWELYVSILSGGVEA